MGAPGLFVMSDNRYYVKYERWAGPGLVNSNAITSYRLLLPGLLH